MKTKMREYKLYIDGKWQDSKSGRVIEVENPATREIIGKVPRGNADDVDLAVKAANAAQPAWSALPVKERADLMRKLADIIDRRKDEFAEVITEELGIPVTYSFDFHVVTSIDAARKAADMAETYEYEKPLDGGFVVREPLGVIAGICPWNYPLQQATFKLLPAIAAGNCGILKPSRNAPLCCGMLTEAIEEAGFPAGVFNLVTGIGGEVGNALSSHEGVQAISFTGSTKGGIEVGKLALDTVKKITLELGGKSPLVVLEGADLKAAVAAVCRSAFMNTGQTCCAYTRFIIPEKLEGEREGLLVKEAEKYNTGDPLDPATTVGPLISEKAFNKVKGYLEKGVAAGARLVTGEIPENCDNGYFVKPAVFMGVKNDMAIAQEEIFGPVLSVISYKDEDEALRIANDVEYGLAGSVFGPKDRAVAMARKIKAGTVSVNGARGAGDFPFGGYKSSGLGREGGTYGFEEFLEIKSLKY